MKVAERLNPCRCGCDSTRITHVREFGAIIECMQCQDIAYGIDIPEAIERWNTKNPKEGTMSEVREMWLKPRGAKLVICDPRMAGMNYGKRLRDALPPIPTIDLTTPPDDLWQRMRNGFSMPDLDIDFSDDGRERVIQYVRQKYGETCVAQVCSRPCSM